MGQHLSHLPAAATRTGGQGGGPKVWNGLILCSSLALLLLHYFYYFAYYGPCFAPLLPVGGSFGRVVRFENISYYGRINEPCYMLLPKRVVSLTV